MPSTIAGFATLETERIALGERVAVLGYAPVIQEYLKKGCPQCLRARLWAQVLGAEVKSQVYNKILNNLLLFTFHLVVFININKTSHTMKIYHIFM